jgi:hypothetical protein
MEDKIVVGLVYSQDISFVLGKASLHSLCHTRTRYSGSIIEYTEHIVPTYDTTLLRYPVRRGIVEEFR